MVYKFDETPDHRHNASYRWDIPGFPDDVIGMGTADLDYYCAPCIREELVRIAEENCYNYRQRTDRYYDALTGWYQREYGLAVRKDQVSSIPSTIGAIRIALGTFTKPGDRVIVQTPMFMPVAGAVDSADLIRIDNPMKIVDGHYEIDFEDFEAKVREYRPAAYVMINPHNPTGRVFTRAELERLVDICHENDVLIISDEVHGMVIYEGSEFIPILAVSDKAKDISVQVVSLSKGYNIMSLPHAIVTIADPKMQKAWMRQVIGHSFGYATNSFAIAAVTTILEGKADAWMAELREYLRGNVEYAMNFIRDNDLPLIPFRPEGSFLLWIDCRKAGIGTTGLDRFFMDKAHVHLDDGVENFGSEGEGFVRINLAVTRAVLVEAMDRIKAALEQA